MKSSFSNWLMGFLEGEGSFICGYSRSSNRFVFTITFTQKDLHTLRMIRRMLDCGHIVIGRTASHLTLKRKIDIEKFIKIVERTGLRTRHKRESYHRWLHVYRSYKSNKDMKKLNSKRLKINRHESFS